MFTGRETKLVDIAQLRSGQGISQALLSARSGINRYRLSQLECRYDEPSERLVQNRGRKPIIGASGYSMYVAVLKKLVILTLALRFHSKRRFS